MREMEVMGSTEGRHCLFSLQGLKTHCRKYFTITCCWVSASELLWRVCILHERVEPKLGRFCEALSQSGPMETTSWLGGREPRWWWYQVSELGASSASDPLLQPPLTSPYHGAGQLPLLTPGQWRVHTIHLLSIAQTRLSGGPKLQLALLSPTLSVSSSFFFP